MSEKGYTYVKGNHNRNRNDGAGYKGKPTYSRKPRDSRVPTSSPFVSDATERKKSIHYSFDELLSCYAPSDIDERLKGFQNINETPIKPWCLRPMTMDEINKAWSRTLPPRPRRENTNSDDKKKAADREKKVEEVKKEEEKKGRMDVMDKIEEEKEGVEEKKEEEVKKEEVEEEIDEKEVEEEKEIEEKVEEKEEKAEKKEDEKEEEKVEEKEEKVEEKKEEKEEEKAEKKENDEKVEEKKEEKKPHTDIQALIMEHLNSPEGKAFLEKVLEDGRLSLERRIKRFEQQAKKEQQILSNARRRHAQTTAAPFAKKEEYSPELASFVAEKPSVFARSVFFFKNCEERFVLSDIAAIKGYSLFIHEAEKVLKAVEQEPDEPEEKWYFLDSRRRQHGPYSAHIMRAFYDNKLLTKSTQIRTENSNWGTIPSFYKDNEMAFVEDAHMKGKVDEKKTPKTVVQVMKNHSALLDPANAYRRAVPEEPAQPAQSTEPAPKTIHAPAGAISLEAALSLQEKDQERSEVVEQPSATPLPQDARKVPALAPQDAARVQTVAEPEPEPEPVKAPEPPAPKAPVISPWTKQRLDSKPTAPSSGFSSRIGCAVEPEAPKAVWKETQPASGYVNRIGAALMEKEEKKTWNVIEPTNAVPLEEILKQSQTLATEHAKRQENEVKKSKKDRKTVWKPVDLSEGAATRAVRPVQTAPKCKSIKEIQKEELAKKKEKAKEAEFTQSSGWSSLFSNASLPQLGAPKVKVVEKKKEEVKEDLSFWDIAKKKADTVKKVEKKVEKKSPQGLTREELNEWSKKEMLRLSGSDDISLLDFCFDLDDSQVMACLQDYLGNGKDVVAFGREFIRRKQMVEG